MTTTPRLLPLLALAGLASGCSYTSDSAWNETSSAAAGEDGPVLSNGPSGQSAWRNSNENAWETLVAANGETEAEGVGPGTGFGSPVDVFGDVSGRAFAQGNPAAADAYDAADLSRVSFSTVGADFDPVVTSDGMYTYFASTRHRETADIYRKHVQSRVVTQITTDPGHDVMPTISPDGSRIAYASNRQGNWNIFVSSADGGQARPITDDSAHELHPSWSPDGTRLVYCRLGPVSQRWELWQVDVTNPMVKQQIGFGLFPEFCPVAGVGTNGADRIVFQRARERGSRLFSVWSMDILGEDAGYLTELASRADAALINPTWSRDGNRVAFSAVPFDAVTNAAKPDRADIWMLNIDGTGETNLTADDAVNLMPSWGENNQIFFISDRSGTDNIWSLAGNEAVLAAGEPFIGVSGFGGTRTANQNAAPNTNTVNRKDLTDSLGSSRDPSVATFPIESDVGNE
ncbi:MAG: DPP IV N-terminal domain-containing protein [Planctomycetota bacterium]